MKQVLSFFLLAAMIACNNSKKESKPGTENNTTSTTGQENTSTTNPAASTGSASVTYTIEGAEINNHASLLVTKDKDNLQAGAPFLCVMTSNNAAHNDETLTLNFLLDTKPGTYPVVGSSLLRGKDPNNEMYGGILGGKPTLTDYKVNITECKDLGSNNLGGRRWSISGTCDEVLIKATGVMLLDKSKHHPEQIKIEKISFSNLTFDDNMEEMMKKAFESMKKKD